MFLFLSVVQFEVSEGEWNQESYHFNNVILCIFRKCTRVWKGWMNLYEVLKEDQKMHVFIVWRAIIIIVLCWSCVTDQFEWYQSVVECEHLTKVNEMDYTLFIQLSAVMAVRNAVVSQLNDHACVHWHVYPHDQSRISVVCHSPVWRLSLIYELTSLHRVRWTELYRRDCLLADQFYMICRSDFIYSCFTSFCCRACSNFTGLYTFHIISGFGFWIMFP